MKAHSLRCDADGVLQSNFVLQLDLFGRASNKDSEGTSLGMPMFFVDVKISKGAQIKGDGCSLFFARVEADSCEPF